MTRRFYLTLPAILALFAAQPASAALIDVQFHGAAAQAGTAVVGAPGDIWNQFEANATGRDPLLTTTGQASGLSLSYSADGAYTSTPDYYQFAGAPDADLMQGYLYSAGSIQATISGLAPDQPFSLYLYTQGDDNTAGRINELSVNGATLINTNTNASTLIAGDNYALFQGVASARGDIRIADTKLSGEANLNGFQLQTISAAPEPSSWALMIVGVGLVGLTFRRARSGLGAKLNARLAAG